MQTLDIPANADGDAITQPRPSWDAYFMQMAQLASTRSKDRSTKVGCVIVAPDRAVVSTGYNGFPRGVNDDIDERHGRTLKYKFTEHAERNAVYAAAKRGTALKGCTIYVPWYPCADCARAIIQAGIANLVAFEPDMAHERWGADFAVTAEMLAEAGVDVRFLDESDFRTETATDPKR